MRDGFGELLRRFRVGAGFTQQSLAEKARVSAKGIAALEAGRRRAPRLSTVRALTDALSLGPSEREELLSAANRARRDDGASVPATPTSGEGSSPVGRAGNLPASRTRFVGRADAVRNIGRTVAKERLVTLVGSGGVGKTRLALAIAESLADDFTDGCWFVPLSTLTEPAMVANSLADALGLGRSLGANINDGLRDWFVRRNALIVFDNCEHVRTGVAVVVDHLLSVESDSRIVATSQVPLGVSGEVLRPVLPLTFDGLGGESVELFVDRARAVKPDFELHESNAAAVHEICSKLDHVPLAIELAASRMRAMNPAEIANRLDRHGEFLVNRNAAAPERQRSLLHAVRWSVDLLTQKEKNVLFRLGVFAAPFDLEAAEFVCSGDDIDTFEVFEVVLGLVDRSLVMAVETAETTRYSLLDTIRSFGRDALADASDLVFRTRRYAQYYSDLVDEQSDAMFGPGDQAAFRFLDNEWGHVRATLNIACDDVDTTHFERLYVRLGPVWAGYGRTAEGAHWGARLITRPSVDPAARVDALSVAAASATLAESENRAEICERAIALWREHGTKPPLTAIGFSAVQALMRGDYQRSHDLGVLTVEMSRTVPAEGFDYLQAALAAQAVLGFSSEQELFHWVQAHVEGLMHDGSVWFRISARTGVSFRMFLTKHPDAVPYIRETLRLCVATNNVMGELMSSGFLGRLLWEAGHSCEAARAVARFIELSRVHAPSQVLVGIIRAAVILATSNPVASAAIFGGCSRHPGPHIESGNEDLPLLQPTCEQNLRAALGEAEFAAAYHQGTGLHEAALAELSITSLRAFAADIGPGR